MEFYKIVSPALIARFKGKILVPFLYIFAEHSCFDPIFGYYISLNTCTCPFHTSTVPHLHWPSHLHWLSHLHGAFIFPCCSYAEREENVKADIFTAYRALLKCTNPKMQQQPVDGETMETGDRYEMMEMPTCSCEIGAFTSVWSPVLFPCCTPRLLTLLKRYTNSSRIKVSRLDR